MTPADQLLVALREAGIETRDLRDAAHEAAHAIEWDVPRPWTRSQISACAPTDRGAKFRSEVLARAVEQLVCERLGAPIGPLQHRAMIAAMEAIKFDGYTVPGGLDAWVDAISGAAGSLEAIGLADRVVGLAREAA